MCGHIFLGYQRYQPQRQPQALWRCSVCGRQSHMPLDCCARPDYHLCQPNGMVYARIRQIGDLVSRMQTRLQAWLLRNRQPDAGSVWAKGESSMAHEPRNALLPDMHSVFQHGDVAEETFEDMHDDTRELQLR